MKEIEKIYFGDSDKPANGSKQDILGWLSCFGACTGQGSVFAEEVDAIGRAWEHPALKKGYEMGKRV